MTFQVSGNVVALPWPSASDPSGLDSVTSSTICEAAATPPGSLSIVVPASGGVAALNHRLMAGNPPGSSRIADLSLLRNDRRWSGTTLGLTGKKVFSSPRRPFSRKREKGGSETSYPVGRSVKPRCWLSEFSCSSTQPMTRDGVGKCAAISSSVNTARPKAIGLPSTR